MCLTNQPEYYFSTSSLLEKRVFFVHRRHSIILHRRYVSQSSSLLKWYGKKAMKNREIWKRTLANTIKGIFSWFTSSKPNGTEWDRIRFSWACARVIKRMCVLYDFVLMKWMYSEYTYELRYCMHQSSALTRIWLFINDDWNFSLIRGDENAFSKTVQPQHPSRRARAKKKSQEKRRARDKSCIFNIKIVYPFAVCARTMPVFFFAPSYSSWAEARINSTEWSKKLIIIIFDIDWQPPQSVLKKLQISWEDNNNSNSQHEINSIQFDSIQRQQIFTCTHTRQSKLLISICCFVLFIRRLIFEQKNIKKKLFSNQKWIFRLYHERAPHKSTNDQCTKIKMNHLGMCVLTCTM